MIRTVSIVHPGMFTTVQDAGRPGWQRYGLPAGGAMDRLAYAAATRTVGNLPGAAVLECTGILPGLEFNAPTRIAVADRQGVTCHTVSAGDRIASVPLKSGYRAYMAFDGGLDVPQVMGSRSTYLPGRIGGVEGRILRAGDVLPLFDAGDQHVYLTSGDDGRRSEWNDGLIRVIPGPEAAWFDCGGLNVFLTHSFRVSSRSDRTGLRLEGQSLSFRSDVQMVSGGLSFGTIQVPPSGLPIVMMADHPTTGGYPRIGCVMSADLPRLAQLRPGDEIRFVEARSG